MKPNLYPAYCSWCGDHVVAEGGFIVGRDPTSRRWKMWCGRCERLEEPRGAGERTASPPPPPPPPKPEPPPWTPPVPHCLRVLGLRPPTSHRAIREAYRTLALDHHPDRGGDARRFVEIHNAYEVAMKIYATAQPSGVGR